MSSHALIWPQGAEKSLSGGWWWWYGSCLQISDRSSLPYLGGRKVRRSVWDLQQDQWLLTWLDFARDGCRRAIYNTGNAWVEVASLAAPGPGCSTTPSQSSLSLCGLPISIYFLSNNCIWNNFNSIQTSHSWSIMTANYNVNVNKEFNMMSI